MTDISLEELAARIRKKGRIGKYDVQAMEREILKDGLGSRAEAELLIALDRAVESTHFSWPVFFAAVLTDFAVWNSGRAGYIDADKAHWLLPLLAGEGATGRATRALAAIAQEAECFDEAFFTRPMVAPGRRSAPVGQELACAA
jgi:hypothetical protein